MKEYLRLMRPKHWVKNLLIFAALVFSGRLTDMPSLSTTVFAFFAFCLAASAVYILNDIKDVEKDRNHEVKKNRPIASGKVPIANAWALEIFVLAASFLILVISVRDWLYPLLFLALYFVFNVCYSFGCKNVPILDIAILVSGFLLRVLYGGAVIQQQVSSWLYLTVISLSFYLVLGKRRNELIKTQSSSKETRSVLKFYNQNFLDKNMYTCLAITIVFYSLWCVDSAAAGRTFGPLLIWTVPLVMLICMKYSLCVESGSYADPVDVLLSNKTLLWSVIAYCVSIFVIIYLPMLGRGAA